MEAIGRLDECAKRIRESHSAVLLCLAKARETITLAISAGKVLIKAKGLVEHGKWLPWVKANCPAISGDTVERYMRLINGRERN